MSQRNTEDLWPQGQARMAQLVRETMALWREIHARETELLDQLERDKGIDVDEREAHHATVLGYADLAREIREALDRAFTADPHLRALPIEWVAVLSDDASDAERLAAAKEYAARAHLRNLLHPRRFEQHWDRIRQTSGGDDPWQVLRGILPQALLTAAVEARTAQPSVVIERRRYTRGRNGGPVVPRRDLPAPLLRKWMLARIRDYVMDHFVPDWRERRRLTDAHVSVVSLDDVRERLNEWNDVALEDEDTSAHDVERIESMLAPLDRRITALRARGLTHSAIAREVGRSPDDVRQRWSRLRRRLLSQFRGLR